MSEETKAAIRASLDVITDAQQSVAAQQAIVAVEVAKISELVQPANPVLFQVRIKAGVTLNVRSIPNSTDPATVLRTVTAASGPLNVYESVRLPGLSFDWYRIAPAQPEWISGHPNYSVVP